jgi:hypothetical protein
MTHEISFPRLEILPLERLCLHEHVDEARLPPLIAALEADGCLRNPPLVLPMDGERSNFVVLDGATRTMAFRRMGIPEMMVQVVRPDTERVALQKWNQVLLTADLTELLAELSAHTGLAVRPSGDPAARGRASLSLSLDVDDRPREGWVIAADADSLSAFVEVLNEVVDIARRMGRMERTDLESTAELRALHPDFSALLRIPQLNIDDVIRLAREGRCMPAGLTRFIVSPRALRVNFPLAPLRSDETLQAKQAQLDRWVQERMARRSIRLYQEAVYLFDE